MAFDYYTIVARREQQGVNPDLEILSVWKNGKEYKKKTGQEQKRPNFDGPGPSIAFKDCVYMGGAEEVTDEDACRWLWGRWW